MSRSSAVAIVSVGDELLAGAHADLNAPYLASRMMEFGRSVTRIFVVGDEARDIAEAVDRAADSAALVFVSGGLGPTLDDVTRHGVAQSVGEELFESDEAWAEVRGWFERAGRPVLESNRRQALMPQGAARVPNGFGTAPGFRAQHPSGASVVVLPGPPKELQGVFEAEVEPWLQAQSVDGLSRKKTILTFGDLPESTFAEGVGAWMERDCNPLVGVTVKDGILTASCVGTAATGVAAQGLADARAEEIRVLFPGRHLGGPIADFGAFVGAELLARDLRFTVAESCTSGAVADAVCAAPGISAVFDGSYVVYANDWKSSQLGVPVSLLAEFGAVSRPVAAAMATGALERSGADLAVSVTGIAGPGGGSEEKPVGLVWFGIATRLPSGEFCVDTVDRQWPALGRERVRRWARNKALGLLLAAARGQPRELGSATSR